MRRVLAIWLAVWVLLGTGALPSPAALAAGAEGEGSIAGAERYARVATEKGTLNMRSEAKDKAEVLSKLPKGAIVVVLENLEEWTKVLYKSKTGYVKAGFLDEITELPYTTITKDSDGALVLAFKKALRKLEYLKSEEVNKKFDAAMEKALMKIQLLNGVELNPGAVSPELQALMEWGMLRKGKSGYIETNEDEETGLSVSIFCWDTAGVLFEDEKTIRVEVTFAAQAMGGQPPYTVTVRKSISGGRGGEAYGDEVTSPFSHIWTESTDCIYLYATAVDAAGNTVTACTPFRYAIPARYKNK